MYIPLYYLIATWLSFNTLFALIAWFVYYSTKLETDTSVLEEELRQADNRLMVLNMVLATYQVQLDEYLEELYQEHPAL